MSSRARFRGGLGAAVAAALLCGLVLVWLPSDPTPGAPPPASPGQGRPLGAVPPPTPAQSRADAVTTLLRVRADALLRRDEAAFLATIDPAADPDFAVRQRALFAHLGGVPLDAWEYHLAPDDALDTSAIQRGGADELWAPAVELRYALRGADLVPTGRAMGYLFARTGGNWYLRSDTALDGLGRHTWRGPWDFGPCQVTTTGNGIVLAHPGSERLVERLARELDSSVAAVSKLWGTDWSQRVALLVPDTPEEMRALVGAGFPVESVVAVAVADRVDSARRAVAGQRVVLSPTSAKSLSAASLRVVLRHEILHVAARAETVDGSPMWLLEGFADYVGYRESGITLRQGAPDLADRVRRGDLPRELPQDQDFRSTGRDLDLVYQKSWSVARFIAQRFGEDRLVALYRRLAGAGPMSAAETDELLRAAIGLDRAGLVQSWRQYLHDTLG
ncbi:MAG TPA: hypothetical protein VFV67_25305 [Actinophytocola sp.]|uniref:hypothetical protein n=1 Tax=Actinophytocola sp. TaxID=1872138 RepID=UPI002DBF4B4C|nr:hypothetical protein [Actinophytocola sp.]HEU5473977.1 hypothetical protein [Actinophytocola sp.]